MVLLLSLIGLPVEIGAQEPVAGLVIVDADGSVGYGLVSIPEGEISGIDLLRRSGAAPVTVAFGGLGEGVCGIGRTGCAVDVCRRSLCQSGGAESPYWQSFSSVDGLAWRALPLGASADRVSAGEIRLWAWTAGVPTAPPVTMNDISRETTSIRGEVIWGPGHSTLDPETTFASPWVGFALLGLAGMIAAAVTVRTRSRPA